MNRKECRMARREIEESEINQRLSGQALAHLEACPPCREFHDERGRLRELVGSLDPVAAPGDFDLRLRARIAAERQRSARGFFFTRFVVSTPAIAVAALVVMLAASIVWFARRSGNQVPSTASVSPATLKQNVATDNSTATNQSSAPVEAALNPQSANLTAQASRGRGRNVLSRGTGPRATDFNVRGAESIRQGVSLSAPVKPLVVSLEDGRGGKRKVSLPPVSFGSQRLVDNRVPAGTPNSRSW